MNFLEQLAKEWFEYQGQFVRTNVRYGRLSHGGWTGEIDVAVLDPMTGRLTHIETSSDADTWATRRRNLARKFEAAKPHYKTVFPTAKGRVRRLAVVGSSLNPRESLGLQGVEEQSIPAFISEITTTLGEHTHPSTSAIPEHWLLLRAIQFTGAWGLPS